MKINYDVIIIGGGHAGAEAAYASARLNAKTLLVTTKIKTIGITPCNPAVGGPAKGIVVREIAAFDGLMNKATDKAKIQIKVLNHSRGAAVHALRAQIDKVEYPNVVQNILMDTENLEILEDFVTDLIIKDKKIIGIKTRNNKIINAKTVVLTTGTYLDSVIVNGEKRTSSGPNNEETSNDLSAALLREKIELFRLKTGTPARISKKSIDFSKSTIAPGDEQQLFFSFFNNQEYDTSQQINCYLIHTNEKTHKIVNDNLSQTGFSLGSITGVGPRYCPSIEEKIIRFSDKNRHQLFLEPETRDGDSIYLQGLSTSLSYEIQDKIIHSISGLEDVEVLKYGYAIEYDAIKPHQLKNTLELKELGNLFTAGQINGTSGYEEAAGQGMIAGINAALKSQNKDSFILDRGSSYIGLMIDDLVTKGTEEPYRLLTSRAEHRLLLRNDNADLRLTPFAITLGLISHEYQKIFSNKLYEISKLKEYLNGLKITNKLLTDEIANEFATSPLKNGINAIDILKRPEIDEKLLKAIIDLEEFSNVVIKQVVIETKYEGYISKVIKDLKRSGKYDKLMIPQGIEYHKINNIALEAREKLTIMKPETLGQASRISGVTPADIAILTVYLEKEKK